MLIDEYDHKLKNMIAAHVIVISSYWWLIAGIIITAKYSTVSVMFYFSLYLFSNIFNHLAFFSKFEHYPYREIDTVVHKSKILRAILYFSFLIPISFPDYEPIRSMAYTFLKLEWACAWFIDFIRFFILFTFIGWIAMTEGPLDGFILTMTLITFATMSMYRHKCVRRIWAVFGFYLPSLIVMWITAVICPWCGFYNKLKFISESEVEEVQIRRRNVHPFNENQGRIDLEQRRRNNFEYLNRHRQDMEYRKTVRELMKDWKNKIDNFWCSICLEETTEKQECIQLHWNLTHCFHEVCINNWLQHNKTCPNWRSDIIEIYKREKSGVSKEEEIKNSAIQLRSRIFSRL